MGVSLFHPLPSSNDVGPQDHIVACDIPPQDIQSLMPVVELFVIRRLEARACEAKCLHIVSLTGLDDALGDVRGVRNVSPSGRLLPQGRRSLRRIHSEAPGASRASLLLDAPT